MSGQRGSASSIEDLAHDVSAPKWIQTPWEDLVASELDTLHAVLLGTKKFESLSLKDKKQCLQEMLHWKQYSEQYLDSLRLRVNTLDKWLSLPAADQQQLHESLSNEIKKKNMTPSTPSTKLHRTRTTTPRVDEYLNEVRHRQAKRHRLDDDDHPAVDHHEEHKPTQSQKNQPMYISSTDKDTKKSFPVMPPQPKHHHVPHQNRRQSGGKSSRANDPAVQTRTSVHQDVTQQRIAHQTPITTFWTAVEPYFRPLTDDDISWLSHSDETSQDASPFLLPLLGRHYATMWAEEDGLRPEQVQAWYEKKEEEREGDKQQLQQQQQQPFLLPLAERVVAALIDEQLISTSHSSAASIDDNHGDSLLNAPLERSRADLMALEERICRELVYVGILEQNEEVDWSAREDDELAAEIRYMQRQLRQQVSLNKMRKSALLEVVSSWVDYQHYMQKLNDIDKQLEQAYMKRFKLQKKKRQQTLIIEGPDQMNRLLQMRNEVIKKFAYRFPREKFKYSPSKSIFDSLEEKKENVDTLYR